jgi:hypothetical protein
MDRQGNVRQDRIPAKGWGLRDEERTFREWSDAEDRLVSLAARVDVANASPLERELVNFAAARNDYYSRSTPDPAKSYGGWSPETMRLFVALSSSRAVTAN